METELVLICNFETDKSQHLQRFISKFHQIRWPNRSRTQPKNHRKRPTFICRRNRFIFYRPKCQKIRKKSLRSNLSRIHNCLRNKIYFSHLMLKQEDSQLHRPFFIFSHPNRIFRWDVFIFFHHKTILAHPKVIFLPL